VTLASTVNLIDPETRHLFLPGIITKILIILFVLLIFVSRRKIAVNLKNFDKKWHQANFIVNWKIFFGNLALLIGYVFLLELVGFIPATLAYVFLTVLLFTQFVSKRELIKAGIVSVVTTAVVFVVFGVMFNITLP
jgi:hypothetical protein